MSPPAAVLLSGLLLAPARAWVSQSPESLPFSLPAATAGLPEPALPLLLELDFQSQASGAGRALLTHWNASGPLVRGFRLSLEADTRARLHVARWDGRGAHSCYSKQARLDDGAWHKLQAVVTAGAIQLKVDGIAGAWHLGGCEAGAGEGRSCGFARLGASHFVLGGDGLGAGRDFEGKMANVQLRRATASELPEGGDAEPAAAAPTPQPHDHEGAHVILLVVLIPSLLVALALLAFVFGVGWHGLRKQRVMEECALEEEAPIRTPHSWSTSSLENSELAEAGPEVRNAIQALMDATWRDVSTRDRKKGALGHFEVVQVVRNENAALWRSYIIRQRAIAKDIEMLQSQMSTATLTAGAAGLDGLAQNCNEVYLFHGSKPSSVRDICRNDFLLKMAGAHRGTLYGNGVYFAESSSKADEYSEDDKDGIYRGLYAMLLCRVTLGVPLVDTQASPNGLSLQAACTGPHSTYHSVLGDRQKAVGTYREFVLYNSTQAYPEFIIIYRRSTGSA